jgi:hypothetical protein
MPKSGPLNNLKAAVGSLHKPVERVVNLEREKLDDEVA